MRTSAYLDLDPTTPGVAARVYRHDAEAPDNLWLEVYAEYGGQRVVIHGTRSQITAVVRALAATLADTERVPVAAAS